MASFVPPWSLFWAVLRRPRAALGEVAARGDFREARAVMLVPGLVHAGFSLLLHIEHHVPRVPVPGFGRGGHYLSQAIFCVPLYLVLAWVGGSVAYVVGRRLSGAERSFFRRDAARAVFAVAYAIPWTLLFLVPDVVVYLTLGFSSIGKAMRYYAPVAALACVVLGALGLSRVFGMGVGRAALAALAGFIVQALVGGVFLR